MDKKCDSDIPSGDLRNVEDQQKNFVDALYWVLWHFGCRGKDTGTDKKIPGRSLVPANMLVTGKKLSQDMEYIPSASSDWSDNLELVLSRSNPSKVPQQ